MPVATALDQSGAGKMIANAVIGVMGSDPALTLQQQYCSCLSCVMTQFMSNTASCALLALSVSPLPKVWALTLMLY